MGYEAETSGEALRSTLAAVLLALLLATSFAFPLVAGSKKPVTQKDIKTDDPEDPNDDTSGGGDSLVTDDDEGPPGKDKDPPGQAKDKDNDKDPPGQAKDKDNDKDPPGQAKDKDNGGKPDDDEDPPGQAKDKDNGGKPDDEEGGGKDKDPPGKDNDNDKDPPGQAKDKDNGGKPDDESENTGNLDDDLRPPEELITEAERLLALAREANKAKKFKKAAELAAEAESLAELAVNKLLSGPGIVTPQDAQQTIDQVELANLLAAASLSEAETNAVDTASLKVQFESAKQLLNTAQKKIREEDYVGAAALALQSRMIFDSVEAEAASLAEQAEAVWDVLEGMEAFSPGTEGEILFGSDTSSNVIVEAEDHSVTFAKSYPDLAYTLGAGRTIFEANVVALIEFADNDGDNEIDEGKDQMVKVLALESLDWTSGKQKTERGEETTLEVWYHFESLEYDFWILMTTFETPVIKHFSSGDDTVVYFVDGNAMDTKLDLIVNRWPWSSPTNKLALRVSVALKEEGNLEVKRVGTDEEWIVISSDEGTIRVKVVTKAEIQRLDDLSRSLVEVQMSYTPLPVGEILVDFVYPNFGEDTLIHDPQFGIGGFFAYVPVLSPPIITLMLAIASTALLSMRKRLAKLKIRNA